MGEDEALHHALSLPGTNPKAWLGQITRVTDRVTASALPSSAFTADDVVAQVSDSVDRQEIERSLLMADHGEKVVVDQMHTIPLSVTSYSSETDYDVTWLITVDDLRSRLIDLLRLDPPSTQKPYLLIDEVATELRVSPNKVRGWIRANKLKSARLNNRNLQVIRREWVDEFLGTLQSDQQQSPSRRKPKVAGSAVRRRGRYSG